jgi:hypothetical protein
VEPVVSGSSAAYGALQVAWVDMRHVLEVFVWALIVGLAGAAGCWCCGYAVRSAWLKAGPPARRPRARPGPAEDAAPDGDARTTAIDLTVAEEIERGIRDLEAYLASACAGRPDPSGPETGQRNPDAG